MGAIYRREVGAFFTSSIAYVFLAVFYLAAGYFFFGSSLAMATTDMSNLFSSLFFVITILIPVLTMRLFSEEKKQKTEQGLLTAPVSIGGIVMGKYLAALTLYTIGLAIIFVYALILSFFGAVAWGIVISNILALFLLGAAFIAVTLFISSLTENQVVAAVLGMIVLLALALIDVVARYAENVPVVPTVLNALSFYTRYYDFTAGLFDPAGVLFYVSTAVIFNFFTVRVFEKTAFGVERRTSPMEKQKHTETAEASLEKTAEKTEEPEKAEIRRSGNCDHRDLCGSCGTGQRRGHPDRQAVSGF